MMKYREKATIITGSFQTTVEELIPSYEFENIMIRISQEVYDMNGTLITFGSTMRYPELNV